MQDKKKKGMTKAKEMQMKFKTGYCFYLEEDQRSHPKSLEVLMTLQNAQFLSLERGQASRG